MIRYSVIMLAGGIRPSPLRHELGAPVLCLPIAEGRCLLDLWLDAFRASGACGSIRIVVSDANDAAMIDRTIQQIDHSGSRDLCVAVEPAKWRGTGGVIRDVSEAFESDEPVLAVEAPSLPAFDLSCLLDAITDGAVAAVGTSETLEPGRRSFISGRSVLRDVPGAGFVDLKEQLLPALHERGLGAPAITICPRVTRLRDREGYLRAVGRCRHMGRVCGAADIAPSAHVGASSLVGENVVIEPEAVVYDSVLLDNTRIGRGAIICRSVVGEHQSIDAGKIVTDLVLPCRETGPPFSISGPGRNPIARPGPIATFKSKDKR